MLFFDQFSKEGIGSLSPHKSEQQCFYRFFFFLRIDGFRHILRLHLSAIAFLLRLSGLSSPLACPGIIVVVVIHSFSVIQAGRVL